MCNLLEKNSLEDAAHKEISEYGRVDILINGAGGNNPRSTSNYDRTIFDIPDESLKWVL